MPNKNIHSIESKLEELKKCICDEASKNKEFASKINSIFYGDSLKVKM